MSELCESWRSSAAAVTRSRSESSLMLPFLFSYCLKFPPTMVGAVEGKYPERKAAGFGHNPETALVRTIMVKKT